MSRTATPLLAVRQLRVQFAARGRQFWRAPVPLRAVDDINFNLYAGQTLGLVGESGSGKSTLARALIGLQPIAGGAIHFDGRDLTRLDAAGWRQQRREIQMVFQDPLASLNPRMTIGRSVAEPLRALCPELSAAERVERVQQMLERVGIPAAHMDRYPHEFSGGQCQRIGIARALVVRPRLLICDEPVSALDVSIQAQIVNLLAELQQEYGLALLFIAHDLAVVRQISHRVLVMYFGRGMEQGDCGQIFTQPRHPYTRALLASVPGASEEQRQHQLLDGELPSLNRPPLGCAFVSRCPMADEQCTRSVPHARRFADGGMSACHYAVDVAEPVFS